MERVGEGQGKMESYFSTGQSPQFAVGPKEEEEEESRSNAFSFGYLPGVRVLKADVSELSVGSIFIGRSMK